MLLRRYLDKDHAWRSGEVDVEARGLIDGKVGDAYGAAFGWRNFTAMFGPQNVRAGNFVPDLQTQSHLWAYGCGGSSFTSCSGVANTNDFATRTFLSVFTILYGSYFGDWDNSNNLLRAPLGAQGYPLASFWCGRPTWQMHPMALGWPIGYCARITQNNRTIYTIGDGGRQVHTALMGDPTLRQHVVQPPTALHISPPASRGCLLTWSPSPDPVEGYHVFRAGCLRDRFVRITAAPVADTFYVDPSPSQGQCSSRVCVLRWRPGDQRGGRRTAWPAAASAGGVRAEATVGVRPRIGDSADVGATGFADPRAIFQGLGLRSQRSMSTCMVAVFTSSSLMKPYPRSGGHTLTALAEAGLPESGPCRASPRGLLRDGCLVRADS